MEGAKGPRLAICTCGHTGNTEKSQHVARFAPGHGACTVGTCKCVQFTWVRYALEPVKEAR